MTTFYDCDAVRITERWLSVGSDRYPIDQLGNLRKARGPVDRNAQRAACTAVLSLPALVVLAAPIPPGKVLALIVIFVVLPAALAAGLVCLGA